VDFNMAFYRAWSVILFPAVLLTALSGLAVSQPTRKGETKASPANRQEPSKSSQQSPAKPAAKANDKKAASSSPPSLQTLHLPGGTVVILGLDEYQKLLNRIDQLEQQLKSSKPAIPSSCKLSGRVDGELVRLQSLFEFKTDRPGSLVNLGCARAWPITASLDGQLPWLQVGEDGLLIQADSPGVHQAKLDLLLPTRKGFRGADRGFHLDLPRAAITTLEQLDLPGGSSEIRLGDRPVPPKTSTAQATRLEGVAVVPIDYLELSWKGAANEPSKGPPVLSANGRIIVRVQEAQVSTEAEFTLSVLRGETNQWRLHLPFPVEMLQEVKVQPQDEPRILGIDRAGDKRYTLVTVRLKEPASEDLPLHIILRLRQSGQGAIPVGPLTVLDALTQQGELEIRGPDDLRVDYLQLSGEVSRREVSEEQRRDNVKAAFSYWNLPLLTKPEQAVSPLISLQTEPVQGAVEMRVLHSLRLIEGDEEGQWQWRLSSQLEVTPIRTAVDHLEVSIPPRYEYDKQVGPVPADLVEAVTADTQNRVLQIKLAQKQARHFSIALSGSYMAQRDGQQARLDLPRPLRWSVERRGAGERPASPMAAGAAPFDRGGQVMVTMPEGLELITPQERISERDQEKTSALSPFRFTPFAARVLAAGAREYIWPSEQIPERVQLAWRPFRPELPVDALVDVTLEDRQARVRERLQFRFPGPPPSQVLLRMPKELRGPVRILEGGIANAESTTTTGAWTINLKGGGSKEHNLTVSYAVPLPSVETTATPASRRLVLPVVQALQATRGETKIRVWSDSATAQPTGTGGRWEELPAEIVAERDSLPSLVLRSGLESSATLLLAEPASEPRVTAIVDRVLIQASVSEDGSQTYRTRFLLSKWNGRHLDVMLPVRLRPAEFDVQINGLKAPRELLDDSGRMVDMGRLARFQIDPALYPNPPVVEVKYKIDASRLVARSFFQLTLQPSTLLGAVLLGRARWQVDLPAGCLPLYARGGYQFEQEWGWSGPLLAPRPAVTGNELERWLTGDEKAIGADEGEPSLVCWQTTLAALPLVYVSQRIWLLACSVFFLGLGLVLVFAGLPRFLYSLLVLATGAGVVLLAIYWPGSLPPLVYGCEPGAVWLLLVLGVQWMLHERYRRQVVFVPGFTRAKSGSSLIRTGGSHRKRQLSTVDDPAQRGSSVDKVQS
jgi:hypothetical protein